MLVNRDSIILKRPERGFNLRKTFAFINILLFWGLTFYFMRTFFSIMGWSLIYVIFGSAFRAAGISRIAESVITLYIPLILIATFALWGWAGYNRLRYGGMRDKRRVHPPHLTMDQVSDYTGLSLSTIAMMRNSKVVICHFNEARELSDVECFGTVDQPDAEESAEDLVDTEDLVDVDCYLFVRHRTPSPPQPEIHRGGFLTKIKQTAV